MGDSGHPFDIEPLPTGVMTPLQAELLEDGIKPEPDILQISLPRADFAPGAGYTEDGPPPLDGPVAETYTGSIPVYQWDINPHDSTFESAETDVTLDDWDFHLWWQIHPSGLAYTSIQALREDLVSHGGAARQHPMGRSEAVNLVYDLKREAVVAIYGTVKDFRPFVEAFRIGFGIQASQKSETEE